MDEGTFGDVLQFAAVADLDVGGGPGDDLVADLQALRLNDVALDSISVADERDVGVAVGIVLDRLHGRGDVVLAAAEVDDAVTVLVPTADVAAGDLALIVAPAGVLLGGEQRFFRSRFGDVLEGRVRHGTTALGIRTIGSDSHFFSPILGSLVYTAFGLKPVLYAGVVCFLFTACFECLIEIPGPKYEKQGRENPLLLVKEDFLDSLRLIARERPAILKMLLVISVVTCLLQGVSAVGFPYIIRNVLGLSSIYYGFSESAVGLAAIAGGILAGLAASKIHGKNIYLIIGALGSFFIPPGILFLLSGNPYIRYGSLVFFSVLIQLAACGFSIFATSLIQRLTPGNMMGKVSAYTSAFTQCIQPLGQILYGFLFDSFSRGVAWILICTGILMGGFGLAVEGFFQKTEKEFTEN